MPGYPQLFRAMLGLAISALCACDSTVVQPPGDGQFPVRTERVFPGLSFAQPVALLQAPNDPARFFVVERSGSVRVFDNDPGASSTSSFFADGNGWVEAGPSEAGLLGMAFHPDYPANASVYLSYTRNGSPPVSLVSYVSRFSVAGGSIDEGSEQPVLTVDQPYSNHNGGQIGFGPGGYLYIGLGDGGDGGDPDNNGQTTSTLLGAMLRIDVNGAAPYVVPPDNPFAGNDCNAGACPEIFAWGLRNPWRWSFDRGTGDLWLADVGQSSWEEVNLLRKGENYGWAIREGAHCFRPSSNCPAAGLVDPRAEYDHSLGNSVTGGYVYRGREIPALSGYYLYGDFGSGRIWALDTMTAGAGPVLLLDTAFSIASFAQDHAGELYILDYGAGGIHKLVPEP